MSNDTTTIYTTIGSVRGCCGHRHRSAEAAERCLDRDRARCAEHGGYSDRTVVAGESPVGVLADIDTGEPYHPHGRTSRAATVDDIGARV